MADESTMMVVSCPECGQKMRVPASAKGKTCKCVKCGARIALDESSMAAPGGDETPKGNGGQIPVTEPDRLGEMLLEAGLVSQEQRDEALALQKKKGGKTFELLIELGHLDREALHNFLSRQPGVASIDLKNYEIDEKLLELIPQHIAENQLVLPIDKLGKLLTVGMACPLDTVTVEKLQEMTGLRVKPMLCRLDDIQAAVGRYYRKEGVKAADFSFVPPGKTSPAPAATPAGPAHEDIQPKLEALEPLPALTAVVKAAAAVARDPNGSIADLVRIVHSDPALTVWVLSVGNSAAYGLSQQVVSVALAATLMGKEALGRVIEAAPTNDTPANGAPFSYNDVRARAMVASEVSKSLAKASGKGLASAAASASMLHEIGRLALARIQPEQYGALNGSLAGAPLVQAETQALGIGHPDAGYVVVSAWGLPPALADLVRLYLHPSKADEALLDTANIVSLACRLALAGTPKPLMDEKAAIEKGARELAHLGVDAKTAATILAKATAAVTARL